MARGFRIAALLVVVAAIGVALTRVDLAGLGAALAGASLLPVALAAMLNLVGRTAARARRTELLLARRLPFGELVRMHLAGYAAAIVLPGPAEEVVCAGRLRARSGMAVRELLAWQATDKAIGIVSMAAIAAMLLPAGLAAAVGAAALLVLAIAAPRWLVPLGWLVVSNLLCVAMIGLCLAAVGEPASLHGCVMIFCATAVASAVPLVPAQLGTLESAFVLAAVHQGVATPVALAAAVLYHLAQLAPAIAGLLLLVSLTWEAAT
jgi:hypothetical protein